MDLKSDTQFPASSDRTEEENPPKVSCLIVTADRRALLRRSIRSWSRQTYSNRELVVVDNGKDTVEDLLEDLPGDQVQYERIDPDGDLVLGDLRNISLDQATGDFLMCWDDDDWFHPDRISVQLESLGEEYDACCLLGNLFHINTPQLTDHPYRGYLPDGSPSSIIHRRDPEIRYPSLPRQEDTVYLNKWRERRYRKLPLSYSYLFVRCFHGDNVSGRKHFLRRLRNSPMGWIRYMWFHYVKGDVLQHPKFRLTEKERASIEMFQKDSRQLGLF
ncbi:MAG: glycosyltransferase family 2 protein [Balneolaceae bacterium]|nr:glycosyltransferase family 2 protein [Balneolaceae bacterium]